MAALLQLEKWIDCSSGPENSLVLHGKQNPVNKDLLKQHHHVPSGAAGRRESWLPDPGPLDRAGECLQGSAQHLRLGSEGWPTGGTVRPPAAQGVLSPATATVYKATERAVCRM